MNGGVVTRKIMRVLTLLLVPASLVLLMSSQSSAEQTRRISTAFLTEFYLFDADFFGLDNAFGADADLRYELGWNTFFQNRIGVFRSKSGDLSVYGMKYQLGLLTYFPYLIPYRPKAMIGIGFLATDPVTVTPTETFRPSQTTFYFIFGGGITRSIRENIAVELGTDLWVAPYRYRIYSFNRSSVDIEEKQFTHLTFSLGISYIF